MSRINIINSELYGENLSCGWDVAGNCYFVLLDSNTEEPAYWKPVIDSIDGVGDAFKELKEKLTATLREALVDHRMSNNEKAYFYDAEQNRFLSPESFKEVKGI